MLWERCAKIYSSDEKSNKGWKKVYAPRKVTRLLTLIENFIVQSLANFFLPLADSFNEIHSLCFSPVERDGKRNGRRFTSRVKDSKILRSVDLT